MNETEESITETENSETKRHELVVFNPGQFWGSKLRQIIENHFSWRGRGPASPAKSSPHSSVVIIQKFCLNLVLIVLYIYICQCWKRKYFNVINFKTF